MDKICMHFDCGNRNYSGYCKTTACINPKYSNIVTAQYGQGVQKRIISNADRIRAMTDEELADELAISGCPKTHFTKNDADFDCPAEREPCEQDCVKCWLDWLKQEVSE